MLFVIWNSLQLLLNIDCWMLTFAFLLAFYNKTTAKYQNNNASKSGGPAGPSTKVYAWELSEELSTGRGGTRDETVQASLSLELGFASPLTKLCRRSKGSQSVSPYAEHFLPSYSFSSFCLTPPLSQTWSPCGHGGILAYKLSKMRGGREKEWSNFYFICQKWNCLLVHFFL